MTLRLDLLVTGHSCGLKNSEKYFTLIQPKHAYSGIPICTTNLDSNYCIFGISLAKTPWLRIHKFSYVITLSVVSC